MAMCHATFHDALREPLRELGAMIRLQRFKMEWRHDLCVLHKAKARVRIDPKRRNRICPSGEHIEERVDVQAVIMPAIVNRVGFDKDSCGIRQGPGRVCMPFLPLGETGEFVPPERPFHRGEGYHDAVLPEKLTEHFCAPCVVLPILDDGSNHRGVKLVGMMRRT